MLELPSAAEAARAMKWLGVSARDRDDALAARPDPREHPELWRRLEAWHEDLTSQLGKPLADGYDGFPAMAAETDPVALNAYAWLYLAILPETLSYHAEHGIDGAMSRRTLSDLGELMARHRSVHGLAGVGRFGQWCPPLRFRGAEFQLGRLAYDRGHHLLNMHIPAGAPLTPESCDVSLDRARDFFVRHFPDEPVKYFVCHSWLLDPQLTEYLSPQSNIVRFGRRFELEPRRPDADDRADGDLLEYLFHRPSQDDPITSDQLAALPEDTSMRRAYVAHLRSGRHWRAHSGRIPF